MAMMGEGGVKETLDTENTFTSSFSTSTSDIRLEAIALVTDDLSPHLAKSNIIVRDHENEIGTREEGIREGFVTERLRGRTLSI